MHSVVGNKGLSYLEVVKLAIKGLFQDENKRKCGFEVKKFVGIKKSIYICTRFYTMCVNGGMAHSSIG